MTNLLHISDEKFFTQDKAFYKSFFCMAIVLAMQNIVAFSINMTDNIMLGSYSQNALSGATIVNQIFFVIQQLTFGIGNAMVMLGSQYWGKKKLKPISEITGIALLIGCVFSLIIIGSCSLFPREFLSLFTTSTPIIMEGMKYLNIMQWSFVLFIFSSILLSTLRSVETVKIAFYIALVSLIVNASINYVLIFGKYNFPEWGIVGAGVGTLIARALELMIILIYLAKIDKKVKLFSWGNIFRVNNSLKYDFYKILLPIMVNQILWAISIPIQTAILGHLADDAIAANAISSTFFQYLKVIIIALSSTSSVFIGIAIGRGDMKKVRTEARTMASIDIVVGIILAIVLYSLRYPLVDLYQLTDTARELSLNLIVVMSVVMVGMAYQMPVLVGIIQGGGDTNFVVKLNIISMWLIVMPLSFLSAFFWHWPIELVVLVIQSDQLFKCIPAFIHFKRYSWIKKLAR